MPLDVVVVVDDQKSSVFATAKLLEEAGLQIDSLMENLGLVSGSVEAAKLDSLRKVPGVVDVELQREVRVAPPNAKVQ